MKFTFFKTIYFPIAMLGVLVLVYFIQSKLFFSSEIIDIYIDSSDNSNAIFLFVEVNRYDASELLTYAQTYKRTNKLFQSSNKQMNILMIHFYNSDYKVELDKKQLKQLKSKYPSINEPSKKLWFVRDGYLFTGITGAPSNLKLPNDSIARTSFLVPKKGVKAKEVIFNKSN